MSDTTWNRGLDDAAQGAERRLSGDADYQTGYDYGEAVNRVRREKQPEPTEAEVLLVLGGVVMELETAQRVLCASVGHPSAGDDGDGLRCYCGEVREFRGREQG